MIQWNWITTTEEEKAVCLTRQFTTIYSISCNEFKSRWLGWSAVSCTLYRHCHHSHCHYQKCWCRMLDSPLSVSDTIISLPVKQLLSDYIPSYNLYFATSAKIVVDAMLMMVVLMVVVVFGGFVAGQEKRLHIGIDSQEIPHGDEYKDILKNNLKKSDLIRHLNDSWSERYHASPWIAHGWLHWRIKHGGYC